jgi:hypothetical protein
MEIGNVNLKNKLVLLLSSSTNHMISKSFSKKRKTLRVIWTVFGLLSAASCIFLIRETVLEYLEFKVSTLYRFYNERELQLPAITLCNVNRFTTKEAANYLKQYLNKTSLNELSYDELVKLLPTTSHIMNNLTEENKKSLGYSFNDFVLKCELNFLPCTDAHFDWYFDRNLGNCFQFNADRSANASHHNQSRPGYGSGLKMELFVNIYKELENTTKNKG